MPKDLDSLATRREKSHGEPTKNRRNGEGGGCDGDAGSQRGVPTQVLGYWEEQETFSKSSGPS